MKDKVKSITQEKESGMRQIQIELQQFLRGY